jgi:multiple sugar transport system substrate-binding protein
MSRRADFPIMPICIGLIIAATAALGIYLVTTLPKDTDDGRIRLTLALPISNERGRAIFQNEVNHFMEAHPHIEVNLRFVAGNYYQNLLIMIAGGVPPDLMGMGAEFGSFADRGAFLDLTDRIQHDPLIDLENLPPEILKWYQTNGRQIGIPYAISTMFVAYNKRLFDEQGLAYPTDDWNYDDFLKMAKALTLDRDGDGTIDQFGYRGILSPELFGAHILSHDGSEPTCDTPEMIEFVQTNIDLAYTHRVMPNPDATSAEMDGLDIYSYFRNGRAAMMNFATWHLPSMREKFTGLDWDIVLLPIVKQRAQWASSNAILISAQTPYPNEAWQLCKVFFDSDFQNTISDSAMPSNQKVAQDAVAAHRGRPENIRTLLVARSHLRPSPRVPHLVELDEIWWRACQSAWARRLSPNEAMRRAQVEMHRLLERKRRIGS